MAYKDIDQLRKRDPKMYEILRKSGQLDELLGAPEGTVVSEPEKKSRHGKRTPAPAAAPVRKAGVPLVRPSASRGLKLPPAPPEPERKPESYWFGTLVFWVMIAISAMIAYWWYGMVDGGMPATVGAWRTDEWVMFGFGLFVMIPIAVFILMLVATVISSICNWPLMNPANIGGRTSENKTLTHVGWVAAALSILQLKS